MTLCSPDPQAFRPPEEKINVLQVGLPTNFKVARFDSDEHTAMLRQLEADIEAARFDDGSGAMELPVKLKVYDSVFVPLAKWSMLMTGNYRCIQEESVRSIKDAVHGDLEQSRSVYNWVGELCKALGASERDQVPFEKYASAAQSLAKPSSAARACRVGRPTSKGWTVSCAASRRRRACAARRWTRSLPSSRRDLRPIAAQPEGQAGRRGTMSFAINVCTTSPR